MGTDHHHWNYSPGGGTAGTVSGRNPELTAFSLPGTVILVHKKQGGSKLAVHARWLVVRSMLGDQMIAFDPWTGATLKVKACKPLPMVDDNFDDYCGTNWLVRVYTIGRSI